MLHTFPDHAPEISRQISMMSGYIRSVFKCEPQGAWVAERVWEPELASVFHDAGIKYVVLDDTHLIYAGIPKSETYGYYATEDNAKGVFVFPSDKELRYMMPYKLPLECIDHMRYVASNVHDPVFVYGDDGEKFGEWPGTHEWVFREKWLEKFFGEVMKNAAWLETVTLAECLKKRPSRGKVYLPAVSYDEMSEWALPAESQKRMGEALADLRQSGREDMYRPFIRGGFWRNFLTKYPEADHMNKKMIYVSRKFEAFTKSEASAKAGEEGLENIEKELLRGQCNCAYWHGMFGGLYLFHLRRAVYCHLIRSEAMMDKMIHNGEPFCKAEALDMNADGFKEVIMENGEMSLYIDPAAGGRGRFTLIGATEGSKLEISPSTSLLNPVYFFISLPTVSAALLSAEYSSRNTTGTRIRSCAISPNSRWMSANGGTEEDMNIYVCSYVYSY
ncbi:MAG: alpha-amylase/4-alpha-glucanotransferase domain-containing protein [Candidatus Omnitrophota bacterium]